MGIGDSCICHRCNGLSVCERVPDNYYSTMYRCINCGNVLYNNISSLCTEAPVKETTRIVVIKRDIA